MADNFNFPCLLQAATVSIFEGKICLITSRKGKRWVIPKGSISKGKTAPETALIEAWEEAGLTGKLEQNPLGTYAYAKSGFSYLVTVFLMQVTSVLEVFPEHRLRLRKWVTISEAFSHIQEKDLQGLLQSLPLDLTPPELLIYKPEIEPSAVI